MNRRFGWQVAASAISAGVWVTGNGAPFLSYDQLHGAPLERGHGSAAQALMVDSVPSSSLGRTPRTGPNYEFGRVATAFFLRSDGFAVADNVAREVRLFDRQGNYHRTIGRRGSGPGEVGFLGWSASIRADSILVWDPAASRASRFSVEGVFTGHVSVFAPLTIEWLGTGRAVNARPAALGVLDDGALVARLSLPTASRTQGRVTLSQDTLPLVVFSPTGELVARIGPIPGDEYFGGDGNVMERPFGARLKVSVRGNRIAAGTGVRYEVTVYGANGNVIARQARPTIVGEQISSNVVAAYKEWYLQKFAETTRPTVRRELDAVPFPSRMPVYETLMWDSVGRLWVQRYAPPHVGQREGSRDWDVLLTDGRWIDAVRMPAGLRVLDISSDRVLGVTVDRDGAEFVQVHAIRGG